MGQLDKPFKIAFLLSGSGSTLENLLAHIAEGKVNATVSVVISSREDAYGLTRAKNWGISSEVVAYKSYKSDLQGYSDKISAIIDSHKVDLVVLGGFMSRYIVPDRYFHRVINIHPALIPAFSGTGYYGERVYKAVLDYGVKVTGCTVHFVDEEYDHGAIIDQEVIRVRDDDTVETLQERVTAAERELYPRVIQAIVENRLRVTGRKVELFSNKKQ